MPKTQRGYRCRECGWETAAYAGRCGGCQAWNSLEQYSEAPRPTARRVTQAIAAQMVPLEMAGATTLPRLKTGIPEFDRVLGGGIVPGSLVLVGGEPGIGKSTLMLQAAAR